MSNGLYIVPWYQEGQGCGAPKEEVNLLLYSYWLFRVSYIQLGMDGLLCLLLLSTYSRVKLFWVYRTLCIVLWSMFSLSTLIHLSVACLTPMFITFYAQCSPRYHLLICIHRKIMILNIWGRAWTPSNFIILGLGACKIILVWLCVKSWNC